MKALLLFLGLSFTLWAAETARGPVAGTGGGAAEPAPDPGRLLVQRAGGLLSSNLVAALARGGPTNALEFCSLHALNLTREVGTNSGVTLRRVSHKARNPANRADVAELRILKEFESRLQPGVQPVPRWETNDTGRITFFSPIVLNQPVCLNCHGRPGDQILPATQEVLNRLYPSDQAVGFRLGDLRGMWRVDFERPAAAERP